MEKHHGRLELREIWALAVRPDEVGFCAAAQVVRIRRRFRHLKIGRETDESVFCITSLAPTAGERANGEALLETARSQWAIENGTHYSRDRSYDEDRCQVRDPNSAQILATLRSLARFLAKRGAHKPRHGHQKTTPALNRFCCAHRNAPIHWLTSANPSF